MAENRCWEPEINTDLNRHLWNGAISDDIQLYAWDFDIGQIGWENGIGGVDGGWRRWLYRRCM